MTVDDVIKALDAEEIYIADDGREITSGYAGDFLSHVMGRAPADCAWFTIMNNVNVCAVATLADIALIVLCEGVQPDDNLLAKVKIQGFNVISTKLDIYNAVVAFDRALR